MAFISGAIIALIGVWLFFARVQTNPERTFWQTIRQGLATSSVTMQASQGGAGNSIKQTLALSLGSTNAARALVQIDQQGTKITSEVVATPEADYTRYLSITLGGAAAAKQAEADKLEGLWAKSNPQLFGQASLGLGLSLGSIPVPMGEVTPEQRRELLKQIRERSLYRIDFANVKKEHKNGRLLYTYDVESAPFVYVQVMKLFARNIGISALEQVDPADYRELATVKMTMTIDVRARQLIAVTYPSSNYTQTYSAYGVPMEAEVPSKHIPIDDLSGRFQSVFQ